MWIQSTINLVFKKSSLCKIFLEKDFGISMQSSIDKHTFCIFYENMHSPTAKHVSFFVIFIQYVVLQYCISKLQFLLYSNIPVMGLLYQGLHFISPTYFRNIHNLLVFTYIQLGSYIGYIVICFSIIEKIKEDLTPCF